ncbi:MAG: diaminopimelate epimerase [Gammaproteobacteria bacterium]|nr:diaminopimelate epimerase [Gammaproteobacteria bacterium]
MPINYTKMNSQGNDFIIIDITTEMFEETQENITKICSKGNIGCDQLLLINTSNIENVGCIIYNSDGTGACQCGNGLRAIMLYLNKKFSITESTITICDVNYKVHAIDKDKISVELGKPRIENLIGYKQKDYPAVFIGNLHIIIENYDDAGRPSILKNMKEEFGNDYNLIFILNLEEYIKNIGKPLRIKVNERGAGWTKSCGSGAAAAAAYLIEYNYAEDSPIIIEQDGGILEVHWDGSMTLKLVGPSEFEYDGIWDG